MQLEDYTTGTVSVSNGSTAITGSGTAWSTAQVKAGDTFHAQGLVGIIETVTSDTALVLRDAWTGTSIAAGAYLLRFQPDNSRMQGTTRQLLDQLRQGLWLTPDATGVTADKSTYDDKPAGFRFLDVSVDPFKMYVKESDTSADWSSGADWVGPRGADGTNGTDGTDGADGAPGSSDVVGTSVSSLAIATGSKTFAIAEADRGWGIGARLRASSDADGSNFMEGVVTAYAGDSLTLSVDLVGGSGTKADWTINLAGERGLAGTGDVSSTDTDASSFGFVIDEDDMASDSEDKVPTQQSVKAFASDPANQSWTAPGADAIARNVNLKLRDIPVSPEDYGADGGATGPGSSGGTDDQAAWQNAINAAIAERKILKASGAYRIGSALTVDLDAITNQTDPRVSIVGYGGAGTTLLYFDSGDYDGLTWLGGSSSGTNGMGQISGIDFRKSDTLGSGVLIKSACFMRFADLYCSGWNIGFEEQDCLSSSLYNVVGRFNKYGGKWSRASGSQPNAIGMYNCVWGNNTENGLLLVRPGNICMFDGSIESNGGTGTTDHKGGAYITEGGSSQAGVSFGLFGTYVENNVGNAQIEIDNSTGNAGVYAFHGASFQRISNTAYATNMVRVTGSSPVILGFASSAFKRLGTYTADAGRPYIDVSDNPAAIVNLDRSNYQMDAVEAWKGWPRQSGVAVAHTGDTTETTLATVTIPANMLGLSDGVRVTLLCSVTNSANNKQLRVKFGGTTFGSNSLTTSAASRMQFQFWNRGATNSQVAAPTTVVAGWGASAGTLTTMSKDTTSDQDITITAQLASGSETITLEAYTVEIVHGS